MKTIRDWLVGNKIISMEEVEDYYQLKLSDGGIMSIYNPVKISRDKRYIMSILIQEIEITESEFLIKFENNDLLSISLLPEDYETTEAFCYNSMNNDVIVG